MRQARGGQSGSRGDRTSPPAQTSSSAKNPADVGTGVEKGSLFPWPQSSLPLAFIRCRDDELGDERLYGEGGDGPVSWQNPSEAETVIATVRTLTPPFLPSPLDLMQLH